MLAQDFEGLEKMTSGQSESSKKCSRLGLF